MKYSFLIVFILFFTACEKMVAINPPVDQLTASTVFSDSATASAVAASMYSGLNTAEVSSSGMTVLGGYSSDEFTGYANPASIPYVNNQIPADPGTGPWSALYKVIFKANDLLEQLGKTNALSASFINQLSGEAKFMRAFSYFYLTNFYGQVPLIISTDVANSAVAPRTDTAKVYAQIIADLKSAQALLPEKYFTGEKARVNKWGAVALLARVYLYTGDYANAEGAASQVIASGVYSPLADASTVFLKNSKESILQLWTPLGYSLGSVLNSGNSTTGTPPLTVLTKSFSDAIEVGDLRKTAWVGTTVYQSVTYNYDTKYKQKATTTSNMEYTMILRVAEQYLIRAEAVAKQGQARVPDAVTSLNVVRARAGLPAIGSAISQDSCLRVVAHENRIEMFGEWAQRWLDLKRTGQANTVLGALKPSWKPSAALFPVPVAELRNNPSLQQNPGY
jgi:hypothetical protein